MWLATDCDREGQLIGQEILEHCRYRGEVLRVMFTAQDPETIRAAFRRARPNGEHARLYEAAVARRQADQIYNLSLTRTATVTLGHGSRGVIGVGRVKTPTLAIACRRELEIREFVPQGYFEVVAAAQVASGSFRMRHAPKERIAERAKAQAVVDAARDFRGPLGVRVEDKVRDIVGLYLSPPDRALVLCVDEKSQIQALDRSQPVLPMLPGAPERRTHDYKRNGTTSLFAALDVATGSVIGKCYRRHRAREFLDFLKLIDDRVPGELDIHIVMDNYATHKTAAVKAWLARRPHWHVHFTPTSASWINQVERWFAELTRKQLQRGVHTSTRQLEADIRAFIDKHNEDPKPFKWAKSADDILAAVKRFCLRVEQNLCHEL